MLFSGRIRGAQAAACESFSAAPPLRFFYRLLLLLGAAFVAFWLATGAANADAGSAPPAEGAASSGTESPPVAETATDTATEPVSEPVSQQTTDPVTDPTV